MKKDISTEENRVFWLGVEGCSYRVDRWPLWMRGDVSRPHDRRFQYPVMEAVLKPFEILRELHKLG